MVNAERTTRGLAQVKAGGVTPLKMPYEIERQYPANSQTNRKRRLNGGMANLSVKPIRYFENQSPVFYVVIGWVRVFGINNV